MSPSRHYKLLIVAALTVCAGDPRGGIAEAADLGSDLSLGGRRGFLGQASLVDQALTAELAGDNTKRNALLAAAIAQDSNADFARWSVGQLRIRDGWAGLEATVERDRRSKTLAEYAARRRRALLTVADQSSLARWCERNDLAGPATAHWTLVLRLDNDNRVAQRALGVARHRGVWLASDDAKAAKQRDQQFDARRRAFAEDFKALQEQLASNDPTDVRSALETIESITDPTGVRLLVGAFSGSRPPEAVAGEVAKRLLDGASRVDEPWAVDFAVFAALHSEDESVRGRAVESLRHRDETEYVPALLSRLRAPLELSAETYTDSSGSVVSRYDAYREGPTKGYDYKRSYERRYRVGPEHQLVSTAPRNPCDHMNNRVYSTLQEDVVAVKAPGYQRRRQQAYDEAGYNAYCAGQEASYQNSLSEESNERVSELLSKLSPAPHGGNPRKLWDWWQKKWDSDPDLRERDTLSIALGLVPRPPTGVASGTLVRTRMGAKPVEELQIGDEVLSKSARTGELAYKPVLAVSVAEGSPLPELACSSGRIALARGQWVWKGGEGWRLPQDLRSGHILHGLEGGVRVDDPRETTTGTTTWTRVVSLVVADFHTFFAGPGEMLLHDTTPPEPSDAATPGWSPPEAPGTYAAGAPAG